MSGVKGKDLKDKRFGYLTVIESTCKRSSSGTIMWRCKCKCGNEILVPTNSLTTKHTKSCGCLQKEVVKSTMSKNMKKYNKFDLSGDSGVGYTCKGEIFKFDFEDYDKIKKYYWHIKKGYVYTSINNKTINMARFILNLKSYDGNIVVDHINHNTTDNRKINLRLCTQSLNSRNNSKAKGVCFDKNRNKWLAYIKINGKMINLGRYSSEKEALYIRKKAEDKYFKDFSYKNSMIIIENAKKEEKRKCNFNQEKHKNAN